MLDQRYCRTRKRACRWSTHVIRSSDAWEFVRAVTAPALALASSDFLDEVADRLRDAGIQYAVANHDTAPIVDWLLSILGLQGISDRAAFAYDEKHGGLGAADLCRAFATAPSCPKLRSFWHFDRCGYRKGRQICVEPGHLERCPVPTFPLRKGALSVGAVGLHLFIRDICGGDLVGWIDARLAAADTGIGRPGRVTAMRAAVIEPLSAIPSSGPKIWSMILSEMLLAGDPARERWVTTGAGMIAIDTLLHNYLRRTGILRRLGCEHLYGPACYATDGCADIVAELARRVDARAFNPAYPRTFARFVQHALWQFCSTGERNICNGVQIDDRAECQQTTCPAYSSCDRLPLEPA